MALQDSPSEALAADEPVSAPADSDQPQSSLASTDAVKRPRGGPRRSKTETSSSEAVSISSQYTIDETPSPSINQQTAPGPGKIDKSQLTFGEIRRLRDKAHLKFVASQPCLICGRSPADAHHLRFTQPRAMGLKVSDEFTVPLCRIHHRDVHSHGDELAWWKRRAIDPVATSRMLWVSTRGIG